MGDSSEMAGQATIVAVRPTRVRYWVVIFAVALAVVTYVDRVAISYTGPLIRHDLGLSAVQLGWAFAAFGWAYALLDMPKGFLGDWIGPRKVLMTIVLWWSFFTAATGWAWSFVSLVTTRALFGAGEAGCFPNLTKTFTVWLPEREKVRAQGVMWMAARWGGAFTPLLVKWVVDRVGWRHAFGVFGGLGVVWAVIFYIWYRDHPRDNPHLNAAERQLLAPNENLAEGHSRVPWSRWFRRPSFWMLCAQYFSLSYGWYFYITWLPTYLREARGLALGSTAMLSTLPLFFGGLGNSISALASGWLVRRTGNVARARRSICYIGFLGAAAFLLLSTRVHNPVYAMLAIAMASFSNDLTMPASWGAAMDMGGEYAGTLSGAMNMAGNIGGAMCPMAIGYLLTWTGNNWDMTFYVSAAVYLTGVVFWRFLDPVTKL
ncbi:MAG: MFS transporter [Bryobacteraceae bacterium]